MEIAYDLSEFGVYVSISIWSPFHVVTKEMIYVGMVLLKPKRGPFITKETTGRSLVIDIGTMEKIKSRQIQVVPAITSTRGKTVVFADGQSQCFDAIIFATGMKVSYRITKDSHGKVFLRMGKGRMESSLQDSPKWMH
ncbi:hypothetical protein OPV22_020666 [Ensete ventricosum]|uniref:indole-3-pyruvate monooxygenase n=1 Tax=Ensete ventricosum TaxID=4639 RepID=A0AAV8QK13_ENSVE|nr:hypothetical protein OPV22_020666 [Ensete ventricosum]